MAKKTKIKPKKKIEINKPKKANTKGDKDKKQKVAKLDSNLDPKLSVDKYFPNRKIYHLCKDTKAKDNSSYLSCTLYCINNKSNKFYTIQLLEHDTQKNFILFSRWGKIDSKGSQEIKAVNFNTGYQLFMKKCQQKMKKGYMEVFKAPEPDTESDKSESSDNTGDKVQKVIEVIKKLSKTESYKITAEKTNPNITDSKIGGLPYWPKNKEYPTNSAKQKLVLLIQINFDKEKVEHPLPKEGMLQIYLLPNDNDLGANLKYDEDLTEQKNFRIIYHNKVDYSITKEEIKKLKLPTHADDTLYFPVKKESKISLKKGEDYITREDFRFNKYFEKAYKEVYKKNIPKNLDFYDFLEDNDDSDNEELEPDENNHKMLGYPYFCQEDPRNNDYYEYEVYDNVLLHLDSQDDLLMWGDCGAASFLIQKKDLIKKKFDDVLYYWDGH